MLLYMSGYNIRSIQRLSLNTHSESLTACVFVNEAIPMRNPFMLVMNGCFVELNDSVSVYLSYGCIFVKSASILSRVADRRLSHFGLVSLFP